ncbi:uncharacterized protein LOC123027080 isoform X1 [Varanus komodoensis]|uniref:uncharacterized protein LOC123027080 isoform X1 n=1 Tax=Varanus komodoensis TaxID=61221 RepID=UPI001CF791C3|nr:uncharacterized protein LOC123027080 isoform X1 [Varanus komodoensis]
MVNARRASGHVAQAARRCRRRGVPQHQKACRTDGSSDKGSCRHGISTHPGYNQGEEPSGQTARFLPVAGVATRKGKRQRNPHASSARKARGKDFGFPLKLESGSPLQFLPGLLPCFLPRWTTAREGTAALAGGLNGGKPGASATRPWRHVAEGGRLPPAVKAPQEAPKHAATFNSPCIRFGSRRRGENSAVAPSSQPQNNPEPFAIATMAPDCRSGQMSDELCTNQHFTIMTSKVCPVIVSRSPEAQFSPDLVRAHSQSAIFLLGFCL